MARSPRNSRISQLKERAFAQRVRTSSATRRKQLQSRFAIYNPCVKALEPVSDSTSRATANPAPTDLSGNAGLQCQSDFYAFASHRPRRFTRSPHWICGRPQRRLWIVFASEN
jgi:hypothetical protein